MNCLDPKNDVIFKKIFGQHPNILRSFLNSILPLAEGQEILELEYLSPELVPETFLEKFTSVDVCCKDNFGRQFLVEMQMNWTTAFKSGILINGSNVFVKLRGKEINNSDLKPVYALNLINQNYLPNNLDYYHHYPVIHSQENNEPINGLEFVFVELQKFKSKNITDKKLQVLWLRFLTEINEQADNIDADLLSNPEIKQAVNFVHEASLNKEEKALYDKNWDRISSEKTILNETFSEGKAEGKIEGKAEGIIEGELLGIRKTALNAKKMGLSISDIVKMTGLSEEEIKEL